MYNLVSRLCVVLTVVLVVQCVCGMVWGLVIALSCRAREQVGQHVQTMGARRKNNHL